MKTGRTLSVLLVAFALLLLLSFSVCGFADGGGDAFISIVSVKNTVPTPIIRSIVLSFSRVVDSSIRGMVTGFVVVAGR